MSLSNYNSISEDGGDGTSDITGRESATLSTAVNNIDNNTQTGMNPNNMNNVPKLLIPPRLLALPNNQSSGNNGNIGNSGNNIKSSSSSISTSYHNKQSYQHSQHSYTSTPPLTRGRIFHEPGSLKRSLSSPWIQKPLHLTYSEAFDTQSVKSSHSTAEKRRNNDTRTTRNPVSLSNLKRSSEALSTFHTVSAFYHTVYKPIDQSSLHGITNTDVDVQPSKSVLTDPSSIANNHGHHLDDNIHNDTNNNNNHHHNDNDIEKHTEKEGIERHLTLFDLVNIGMGSTIGSGIFVLCGFIARNYAGPATCISWALAGLAACLSGVCYAELACRMPSAGSSYVYVYASIGELPAMIAAACLTLEYVVSASAVARSWGDKVAAWLVEDVGVSYPNYESVGSMQSMDGISSTTTTTSTYYSEGQRIKNIILKMILPKTNNDEYDEDETNNGIISAIFQNFNLAAFAISTICVLLLMNGVHESKRVANFFTMTKLLLVIFMTVLSLVSMRPKENLTPFIPVEYGWSGIFRGATSSFFGYLGFDGICCMSGEAINPQRNMPLAIIITLVGVTILYILAALGLSGMLPYTQISEVSGFPDAFSQRDYYWTARICAFGEVFTLPIVVLISILLQPRLQYAMAKDGLLPEIFGRLDDSGNLWHGTVICGSVMITIASLVPFNHLNDMLSAGILLAFCMTDSALVILRHESPKRSPLLVEKFLGVMNLAAFSFGVCVTHFWETYLGRVMGIMSATAMVVVISGMYFSCEPVQDFGGTMRASPCLNSIKQGMVYASAGGVGMIGDDSSYFSTPGLPFVPMMGIFVNWYLICQMEIDSIGLLLCYLLITVLFYFSYGAHNSIGRNTDRWDDFIPLEVVKSSTEREELDKDDQSILTM